MHINFKNITYKNILSVGNDPVSISLNSHGTSLITGANGEGKSIFLEALCLVLYGTSFRKINKGHLVNYHNNKNLEVSIEFSILKNNYKIERGIKPNFLRVFVNGKEVNKEASVNIQQSHIEHTILKMSKDTFKQLIILGSTSYVPFMQLTGPQRNVVIEDLLDVKIFALMADCVNEKIKEVKVNISDANIKSDKILSNIRIHQKHVDELQQTSSINEAKIKQQCDNINKDIANLLVEQKTLQDNVDTIESKFDEDKFKHVIKSINELQLKDSALVTQLKTKIKSRKFLKENDNCELCKQDISKEHKHNNIAEFNTAIQDINNEIEQISKSITELNAKRERFEKIMSIKTDLCAKHLSVGQKINQKQKEITIVESSTSTDNTVSIKEKTNEIEKLEQDNKTLLSNILNYEKQLADYSILLDLFRNKGIKTKIIKTYLPIINQLMIKYLGILGFDISLTFDEFFEEFIKVSGRNDITYHGLSEGQKVRVNLALLFVFRELSKIKNSTSSNLIVFDEIGDSALDKEGFDAFVTILKQVASEGNNVFVISHNDDLDSTDVFERHLHVYREDGFTTIKNI